SNIISNSQAALIAFWIDGKALTNGTSIRGLMPMPYRFKLLYRGSRDGFSANIFHSYCDDQGPTIVVVRIEDSREVIGGYNPIGWSSPKQVEWRATTESYIF